MGWPVEGGIWVLRLPGVLSEDWKVEEELDRLLNIANGEPEVDVCRNHHLLLLKLD